MTVSWSRQALLKDKINTGRYGILLYLFGFMYSPTWEYDRPELYTSVKKMFGSWAVFRLKPQNGLPQSFNKLENEMF